MAGAAAGTDYSVGKGEQKVEMTFGDFGAPVLVSVLLAPTRSTSRIPRRNRWVRLQADAEPGLGGLS